MVIEAIFLPNSTNCRDNHIISLCIPSHSSHLLQPLDVSCFSVLKREYGQQVLNQIRLGINHIDKDDFLEIYPRIRPIVFTFQNIQSGFRATGLIPFDPDRVLSNLTITKTPSPPSTATGNAPMWMGETPYNVTQLEQQACYLRTLLQRLANFLALHFENSYGRYPS
jgi:hypothetical protein